MPLKIVRNDITQMKTDAIVNPANMYANEIGPGCETAIYTVAGKNKLLNARNEFGDVEEGTVFMTDAFDLPAKKIIHAVPPIFINGECEENETLRKCYREALKLAADTGMKSIAFPLLATGNMGYPKEDAMIVAVSEINSFLIDSDSDILVYIVVFGKASTSIGKQYDPEFTSYIDDDRYSELYKYEYFTSQNPRKETFDEMMAGKRTPFNRVNHKLPEPELWIPDVAPDIDIYYGRHEESDGLDKRVEEVYDSRPEIPIPPIEDPSKFFDEHKDTIMNLIDRQKDSFGKHVLKIINDKGFDRRKVYHRALFTRQLFSKMITNENYHPDKLTALRICVGLRLSVKECEELLSYAGYTFNPIAGIDIVFKYFIEYGLWDLIEIDIALEELGFPTIIR